MIPIPLWQEFVTTLRQAPAVFCGWLVRRAWRDRLPARTRARLRAIHVIDRVCYRLVDTGHYQAATLVWRACGLW